MAPRTPVVEPSRWSARHPGQTRTWATSDTYWPVTHRTRTCFRSLLDTQGPPSPRNMWLMRLKNCIFNFIKF